MVIEWGEFLRLDDSLGLAVGSLTVPIFLQMSITAIKMPTKSKTGTTVQTVMIMIKVVVPSLSPK